MSRLIWNPLHKHVFAVSSLSGWWVIVVVCNQMKYSFNSTTVISTATEHYKTVARAANMAATNKQGQCLWCQGHVFFHHTSFVSRPTHMNYRPTQLIKSYRTIFLFYSSPATFYISNHPLDRFNKRCMWSAQLVIPAGQVCFSILSTAKSLTIRRLRSLPRNSDSSFAQLPVLQRGRALDHIDCGEMSPFSGEIDFQTNKVYSPF